MASPLEDAVAGLLTQQAAFSAALLQELNAIKQQLLQLTQADAALSLRLAALEAAPPVTVPKMRIGAVSYFRTLASWDAIIAAKVAVAMINPGSGPGPAPDSLYVGMVPKCRAAGVPVYGYVHTKYGVRPAAEVKADILNHKAWYGIDGIFVDTTSTDRAYLPYYADLCAFIHAQGLKVALNPGSSGPEEHAQMADYVMVAENYWSNYKAQTRPAWESKPAYAGKLWHVIHTCPAAEMPAAVAMAKQKHAGLVYITDDLMPNPYNVLPTYFQGLVAAVGAA